MSVPWRDTFACLPVFEACGEGTFHVLWVVSHDHVSEHTTSYISASDRLMALMEERQELVVSLRFDRSE